MTGEGAFTGATFTLSQEDANKAMVEFGKREAIGFARFIGLVMNGIVKLDIDMAKEVPFEVLYEHYKKQS